jgi:predicted AAA+ superfamily ATPase
MVNRALEAQVRASQRDTPVTMVVGPRQAGKSTLVTSFVDGDRHGGGAYVNFDDPTLVASVRADPVGFVQDLSGTVILDEVQRVPEVFLPIKAEVDRDRRPGRFLLTGSANPLFIPDVAEALAGRMEVLTLWPFSAAELEGEEELRFTSLLFDPDARPPDSAPRDREALARRILAGGFPEAVERSDPDRRARWFASYLTTILERDVRSTADIARLEQLPSILSAIALRTRGPLNKSGLGQDLGIPGSSVDRYLTLLERVFLVRRLPAWHNRLGPRLVKAPKLLVCDSGLLCHLLQWEGERLSRDSTSFGLALECFVGMELAKAVDVDPRPPSLMHYRTSKGAEIDFVLEAPDGRIAVLEVKASGAVDESDFRQIARLRDSVDSRFARGVVLYDGERALPFGDRLEAWPISALWSGSTAAEAP